MFTLNNPEVAYDEFMQHIVSYKDFRYCVFQLEKGTEDTPHYQGYLEFKASQRWAALKKLIPRAHWEARRGSRDQARDYCMKSDSRIDGPWEEGKWQSGGQGARSDLQGVFEMARAPESREADVADSFPREYIKYYKAIQQVRRLGAVDPPPIRPDLRVELYYGHPGTGKTRKAYEDHEANLWAVPIGKNIWYDGYFGQPTVLLDDFSGQLRLTDLLRLLDIYPVQVPVKGTFVWLKANTVIITTNIHPYAWYDYQNRRSQYDALVRRIHSVYWFREGGFDELTKHSFFKSWFESCDEAATFVVKEASPPSSGSPVPRIDLTCFPELVDSDEEVSLGSLRRTLKRTRPTRIGPADPNEPLFGSNRCKKRKTRANN